LKSLVRKQLDMKILHFEGGVGVELLLAVGELEPDIVVLPLLDGGREPGICSHLLEEFNDLVILAVSPTRIRRLSNAFVVPFTRRTFLETIRTAKIGHGT
jgi:hypothetical protein